MTIPIKAPLSVRVSFVELSKAGGNMRTVLVAVPVPRKF